MNTLTLAKNETLTYAHAGNARLHIHPTDVQSVEELNAYRDTLMALFPEIVVVNNDGYVDLKRTFITNISIKPSTRKQYAILPALLRYVQQRGWDVEIQAHGENIQVLKALEREYTDYPLGRCFLSQHPAIFWQELALAQMWFEKSV
jgi:hypothetical protein